jgi:ubiquinone/menaquinone biosynthesis C-methylase UbiE
LWSPENAGNREIVQQRNATLHKLLGAHGRLPLTDLRILDAGCGGGDVLASLVEWGALPQNLHGLELLPQRAAAAHDRHPTLQIHQGNAASQAFADDSFDLVLFFTVFSSVLDESLRRQMAAETMRVLKPGGAVVWYDLRILNPRNQNTRPLSRGAIAGLFPNLRQELRTTTLLPPLARRLGDLTAIMYPILNALPLLRTHYLGLLLDDR